MGNNQDADHDADGQDVDHHIVQPTDGQKEIHEIEEEKIENEIHRELEKDNEELRDKLKLIENSCSKDDSLSNVIDNYSKLVRLEKPQLNCIEGVVGEMKKAWKEVIDKLDVVRTFIGDEPCDDIKKIHRDYWKLLLKTRSKIRLLMQQCKIQKDNIHDILHIINEGHTKDSLTSDQKKAFGEYIESLGKWIDSDIIQALIDEWSNMSERLQKQEQSWRKYIKLSPNLFQKIVLILLGLITIAVLMIGAIMAAAFVSGGACAAAAAGSLAVEAAEIGAVGSVAVAGSARLIYVGAGLLLSGAVYGTTKATKDAINTYKIKKNCNEIKGKLIKMLAQSNRMEAKLNDVNDSKSCIIDHLERECKNTESRLKMERGFKTMGEQLTEYIGQCNGVIDTIQKACNEYIET